MKRLIVVLGSVAALSVTVAGAGCTELKACTSNADCVGAGVCEPTLKICYVPDDAGFLKSDAGDSGVDAGPPVPCGAQGCPEWQTCRPTGPATGVCVNVDIQPVAPGENSVLAGKALTPFKFQVTQWDGGVLERASIPVLTTGGGISGPTKLEKSGSVFQGDFTPANTGGRQSVTAGWAEVNSTISVNTEACNATCAEWQECRPTQDGGMCVSLDLQLAFVKPVGVTVGRNSSVPIKATVSRPDGGAAPDSVPFRTSNGLSGVLAKSASFETVIDGGDVGGDIEVVLGWEDGGTVVSGTYSVDLVPPVLSVTPAAAPVYPGDAGDFRPNDTIRAWRKDETIDVTVTSNSADLDPSTVVVTARHGSETALTLVGTPTDCGGAYCKVFSVDLSQVQMNAFADDVTLSATASDVRGNAMTVPASGAVRVTRWQWARRVSSTESVKSSPAIGKSGEIYVGLAGNDSGGLFSLPAGGAGGASTNEGPVESSPAIGQNAEGTEIVYYVTNEEPKGGSLRGGGQDCTTGGKITPRASVTILNDRMSSVMGVGIQADDTLAPMQSGSRLVGLQGSVCRYSTTYGLATVNSPGNFVASGDSVLWGDSTGKLRIANYSSVNSNFVVASETQSPGGVGIMNGLLLFELDGGMNVAGGGPGIGKLFAYEGSLATVLPWQPDYLETPTSGPILTTSGVVAAIQDHATAMQVQVLRVSPVTGKQLALTSVVVGSAFSGTQVPTPVAGAGGRLYVLDGSGLLAVFPQNFEAGALPIWTAGLPVGVAGTTSASPTIDCNRRKPATHTGILYFVTESGWLVSYIVDSKGLDTSAPWPKYAHDVRNTGNVGVAIEGCQ